MEFPFLLWINKQTVADLLVLQIALKALSCPLKKAKGRSDRYGVIACLVFATFKWDNGFWEKPILNDHIVPSICNRRID